MTNQRATCQGILVMCPCGNGFRVPKRQAGNRVPCTLCGESLPVPAPRSVQQAAADALDVKRQKALWKEPTESKRKKAEQLGDERVVRPATEPEQAPSNPRRRKRMVLGGITVLTVALVAVGGAAVYCDWGTPSECISEAGGFAVRLPSGLTASRFVETRGFRPSYTFEGVSFADGTCVGVAHMDLRGDEPIQELPEPHMRFLEREYHGEVTTADQCEVRLGSHPGRQVTYETAPGSPRRSYSRWFLVGNRLYDVAWISGYRQPSMDAVERFFESFRLLAEPDTQVTLAKQAAARSAVADDGHHEP